MSTGKCLNLVVLISPPSLCTSLLLVLSHSLPPFLSLSSAIFCFEILKLSGKLKNYILLFTFCHISFLYTYIFSNY